MPLAVKYLNIANNPAMKNIVRIFPILSISTYQKDRQKIQHNQASSKYILRGISRHSNPSIIRSDHRSSGFRQSMNSL